MRNLNIDLFLIAISPAPLQMFFICSHGIKICSGNKVFFPLFSDLFQNWLQKSKDNKKLEAKTEDKN